MSTPSGSSGHGYRSPSLTAGRQSGKSLPGGPRSRSRLSADGEIRWGAVQGAVNHADPFEAFYGAPRERGRVLVTEGEEVEVLTRASTR
ncbi:hypothetical protein ABT010_01925 [Streptomyces sp. NPDC002668]|uniref:hypothetical protein n=1 Tax=Streptomyces sp. NPDC002668 TaxID=3154422 RepID=UPI0033271F1E